MSLIRIQNISAGYKKGSIKETVIENITFDIESGELVGILGANGSGKSTLAKAICHIMPHTGQVQVGDKCISQLQMKEIAKQISYIPQSSGLSMDISVLDVVLMGFNARLHPLGNPTDAMQEKAKEMLQLVGMWDLMDTNYMLLSEGQKRLVILARALVNEGTFLVMDEPESSLDFQVRYQFMDIVRSWIGKESRAGLIILHDVMMALNCCDRLILLKEKKIVGTLDLHNDTIEYIEEQLKKIFGNISIRKVHSKEQRDRLIMLYEPEGVCER